jgi:hypothetical protein
VNPFARAVLVLAAAVTCLAPLAAGIQLADSAMAQTVAGPSATGAGDPALTVWYFLDARNRGDLDAALALVSDDLAYVDGVTCPAASPCVGRDVVRRQLADDMAEGTVTTILDGSRVSGARVQLTALTWAPELEVLGVDRVLATITAEAPDGKLTLFRSDPDRRDARTAWWLGHRAARRSRRRRGERDAGLPLGHPEADHHRVRTSSGSTYTSRKPASAGQQPQSAPV